MQRILKVLKGYAIGATDGDIGTVDNFYFDDEAWTIRYLVADTGNWLNVKLTKKQVEESPSIDTDKPVSRQHEASYLDYYRYPYYWGGPYLWGAHDLSSVFRRRSKEK